MSLGQGGRIWYVGISCDSCGRQRAGDYAALSQGAAEDGLRAELVAERGWSCDAAGDFCDRCRPAPAGLVEEEAPVAGSEAPAPRRAGPPEVEALHAIDRLIGNADTLDADAVGRVRGVVLDALTAWHARQRLAEQAGAAGVRAPDGGLWG